MTGFRVKCSALATAVLLAGYACSFGQERLISVTGTGSVELMPDVVVAYFSVTGTSETVAGALEDFRRNRQRIEDTLNPMDFPGVSVEFKGKSVGDSQASQTQMMVFGDGRQEPEEEASSITESFQVRFMVGELGVTDARLEELSRIIDATIAAKARPGMLDTGFYNPTHIGSGIVSVTASSTKSAEQSATRAAFENAREKAAFLAALSGMELGEVHSIELSPSQADIGVNWTGNPSEPAESTLVGSRILIQSSLTVSYSIRPKMPE